MFDAVKKVLLATIFHQGTVAPGENPTEFNWAFTAVDDARSNEEIGEVVRSKVDALGFIKSGFDRLGEFKPAVEKKPKDNPAV